MILGPAIYEALSLCYGADASARLAGSLVRYLAGTRGRAACASRETVLSKLGILMLCSLYAVPLDEVPLWLAQDVRGLRGLCLALPVCPSRDKVTMREHVQPWSLFRDLLASRLLEEGPPPPPLVAFWKEEMAAAAGLRGLGYDGLQATPLLPGRGLRPGPRGHGLGRPAQSCLRHPGPPPVPRAVLVQGDLQDRRRFHGQDLRAEGRRLRGGCGAGPPGLAGRVGRYRCRGRMVPRRPLNLAIIPGGPRSLPGQDWSFFARLQFPGREAAESSREATLSYRSFSTRFTASRTRSGSIIWRAPTCTPDRRVAARSPVASRPPPAQPRAAGRPRGGLRTSCWAPRSAAIQAPAATLSCHLCSR